MNVSDAALGSGVAIVIDCRTIDLDIEGLSESAESNPGGFVCLNDDDDNNNNVPDKDESGAITGEDDLVVLSASVADGLTGTVTLSDLPPFYVPFTINRDELTAHLVVSERWHFDCALQLEGWRVAGLQRVAP